MYHVASRGNRRAPIFRDDLDYEQSLAILAATIARHGWRCHAYCLMPNHYHLLVETPNADLSRGMQRLNSAYAQWFNWRHGLSGHLFQGRFFSTPVEGAGHLLELARYAVLNPVRAGLCRHPADWRWSSYVQTVVAQPRRTFLTRDWLLAQFSPDPRRARTRYAAFVADAVATASDR